MPVSLPCESEDFILMVRVLQCTMAMTDQIDQTARAQCSTNSRVRASQLKCDQGSSRRGERRERTATDQPLCSSDTVW